MSEPQHVLIRLDLPEAVLAPYQFEADQKRSTLKDVVGTRLKRCQGHKANRPLYFNDAQHAELEHLLGNRIEDADEALKRIAAQARVEIGGVNIQLTDYDLRRLKARMRKDKTFESQLQFLIDKLLQRYLRGEL